MTINSSISLSLHVNIS